MKKEELSKQWYCEQVRGCEASLYRTAMCLLQNRQDAEDAIQEALYIAYEKLDSLKSPDKFKPWLLKILTNTAYDILRRRRPVLSLEDVELTARQEDTTLSLTLAHAVAQLPPDYRQVVTLYYYEDMTIRQIADIIGCAESVVKTRLFRARKRLRALLED
ncbi:MAG: RNA polymerase sigma factor [Clostridiales bacterium]|nr:RNA polymerase sigma factor [Clostridiales bacterium]